jgi:pyruvate ferredoxin oxidoreductase gamma subunit
MMEVRFHGRGGQGAVTSAEMVAMAAIGKGKYAQAMPSFGAERRGAPVQAFARVDDHPITIRQEILEPDAVVVLDPTLLATIPVTSGIKQNGVIIINTHRPLEEMKKNLKTQARIAIVDASHIAREVLGRPITNTTMLGALIKVTGMLDPEDLVEPLKERFGKIAGRNIDAMKRAYNETKVE